MALQVKVSSPQALDRDPTSRADVQYMANKLMDVLAWADRMGYVVEVTLESVPPLTQGRYQPHIQIRERKELGMLREQRQARGYGELSLEPLR